jgi:hypothetical protein
MDQTIKAIDTAKGISELLRLLILEAERVK